MVYKAWTVYRFFLEYGIGNNYIIGIGHWYKARGNILKALLSYIILIGNNLGVIERYNKDKIMEIINKKIKINRYNKEL